MYTAKNLRKGEIKKTFISAGRRARHRFRLRGPFHDRAPRHGSARADVIIGRDLLPYPTYEQSVQPQLPLPQVPLRNQVPRCGPVYAPAMQLPGWTWVVLDLLVSTGETRFLVTRSLTRFEPGFEIGFLETRFPAARV